MPSDNKYKDIPPNQKALDRQAAMAKLTEYEMFILGINPR